MLEWKHPWSSGLALIFSQFDFEMPIVRIALLRSRRGGSITRALWKPSFCKTWRLRDAQNRLIFLPNMGCQHLVSRGQRFLWPVCKHHQESMMHAASSSSFGVGSLATSWGLHLGIIPNWAMDTETWGDQLLGRFDCFSTVMVLWAAVPIYPRKKDMDHCKKLEIPKTHGCYISKWNYAIEWFNLKKGPTPMDHVQRPKM